MKRSLGIEDEEVILPAFVEIPYRTLGCILEKGEGAFLQDLILSLDPAMDIDPDEVNRDPFPPKVLPKCL